MIIVKKSQVNSLNPDSSTKIDEYEMDENSVSGALADINGRYPDKGFAVNEISKEIVYIIHGNGRIVTEKEIFQFSQGDVIFIDFNEKFFWEGNFSMFMVTAPKFDPKQHKIIV